MPYHLYHTEGFVLSSRPSGEANKVFFIFTPDLGLISASAQSVRRPSSKLRGNLLELSHARITVVRGKEMWRIVSAEGLDEMVEVFNDSEKRKITARIFAVLFRLIHGEERSEELYEGIKDALAYLVQLKIQGPEAKEFLRNIEYITVMRIMNTLGYLNAGKSLTDYAKIGPWSDELVRSFSTRRTEAVEFINASFRHSHL